MVINNNNNNNHNNKAHASFYSKSNIKKGIEDILILILNTMMYAERQAYLQEEKNPNNKANGYRPVSVRGEGGRRLILAIPRDRLIIFRPYLMSVLKSEGPTVYALCDQLYSRRFPARQIKKLFEQIYTPKYAPKTITTMIRIFKKQLKNKLK